MICLPKITAHIVYIVVKTTQHVFKGTTSGFNKSLSIDLAILSVESNENGYFLCKADRFGEIRKGDARKWMLASLAFCRR